MTFPVHKDNPIFNTDSYKYSHFLQYPPGTTHVSSYIEARDNEYKSPIIFFGLQMWLKTYMARRITHYDVEEANEFVKLHGLPFNYSGFRRIIDIHKGIYPVTIQAVAEGSKLMQGEPQVQITNNDPELPWLSSFLETQALRATWYPTTVASLSYHVKQIIKKHLEETADDTSGLPFKLHDFGARGATCFEQAGIGGCAHLVNFMGSDTVPGLVYARNYYGERMAGFSIPAAEHSTITSWGKENERAAYENMVDRFGGDGNLFAVVSDSYDVFNACDHIWGEELKDRVIHNGGCLVVRPDSGDPTKVPELVISKLGQKFGSDVNSKGHRMLPKYLRVIQGDGMNPQTINMCLHNMRSFGHWSADNIAFGMGAALLQKVNRDTLAYAQKGSAIRINNGEWVGFNKEPIDMPMKASKKGRFDYLPVVWENGQLKRDQTFAEIRAMVNAEPVDILQEAS